MGFFKKIKKIIKEIFYNFFKKAKIKDIIILESRPYFSDNTKRIYDYLLERKLNEKYKLIWIVEEKKVKKINIKNVKLVKADNKILKYYYLIHAKYIINCNIELPKVNENTISMNLWHGTLLKNLKDMRLINEKNINYCLCPSKFYQDIYEEQLHIPKEKLLILNNPRNDYLFSNKCDLEKIFGQKFSKYIIWMPTFRNAKFNNNDRVDSNYKFNNGIPILQTVDEVEKINEFLKQQDILLVIKPHFVQDMSIFKMKELSNIKIILSEDLINRNIELYEFLGKFDALLTDYSSVYFDYLITNKPIGFTIDDFESYSNGKGFIFDNTLEYMPGMKIKNFEQLQEFFYKIKNNIDEYGEERVKINKLVNTYNDDKNAERVVNFLKI